MDDNVTPVKRTKIPNANNVLNIPASPYLKRLGYGTGVQVYRLNRSPYAGKIHSPWALKYVTKRKTQQSDEHEINNRLNKEADILKKIDHPNIVGFRAFSNLPDGRKVLAMEDCEVSLGDLIETRNECGSGPFPAENVLTMITDIAAALQYLHDTIHLLHGDIKSHNILTKGAFSIFKLCDFGVSIPLDSRGVVLPDYYYCGTELWLAPEIVTESEVTTKADLFAFGLSIWEMISLRPPHIPDGDCEDLDRSTNNDIGTRPDLPNINFNEEYNLILECFYLLTELEPKNRPSAAMLLRIIKK